MFWNIFSIIPLTAFIAYSLLLSIVIWRNPGTKPVRIFILYLMAMVIWSLGSFLMHLNPPLGTPLFWNRFMTVGVAAMSILFYSFVRSFLGIKKQKIWLYLGAALYISLFIANALGYFVKEAYVLEGVFYCKIGIATYLGFMSWILFVGLAAFNLIQRYRKIKDNFYRNRLKYLLIGILIMAAGTSTNFTKLGRYPLDILINTINASLIAYVILKYKLLDINIIIRKGFVYFALTAIIASVYLFMIFILERLLRGVVGISLVAILMAIGLALLFQPLRDYLQRWIDRLFFREKFDYYQILRKFAQKMITILDLDDLANSTVNTIGKAMQTDKVAILLGNKEEFYLKASVDLDKSFASSFKLKKDNPLLAYMVKKREILTRDEIDIASQLKGLWESEVKGLEMLKAELFIPLITKDNLIGIITLGKKLSEDSYSEEEHALLSTVAHQAAVAFENAMLYGKIKESLLERKKLHQILLNISSTFDISRILRLIVDSTIKFTNSQRSIIMILDKKREKFYQAAIGASNKKFSYPIEDPRSDGIFWGAIRKKKPILAKEGSSGFSVIRPEDKTRGIRTMVGFPLVGQEGILGVLVVSSTSVNAFGEEEMQRLSILAEQAAITLGKAQLIKDIEQAKIKLQNWGEELERKVKEKTEELEHSQALVLQSEKLAGLGQLAAGVAHEIRNPLGIIATSMYYLNEILPEKRKEVKKHFHIVESEIDRCQTIITNLLEFSRTSDKEIEPVDVNALVNMSLSLVEKELFGHDIRLIKKMETVPKIKANLDEMKQVFLNLILNATQAMPKGGKLRIITSTHNDKVRIKLSDTGMGISKENLDKVFNPFFTTKEPGEGTGLGLAFVHTIIERYGGTIRVKSEEEKGTTFTIELSVL